MYIHTSAATVCIRFSFLYLDFTGINSIQFNFYLIKILKMNEKKEKIIQKNNNNNKN